MLVPTKYRIHIGIAIICPYGIENEKVVSEHH